jgi:hypothetical protein
MSSPSRLSPADEQRLHELLPWYVNGTLGSSQRKWVDDMIATYPDAATALTREKNLSSASETMLLPVIAQDLGLARLRSRIKADTYKTPTAAVPAERPSLWARLQQWLAQPQWTTAMGVLVLAQAGLIGWLATATGPHGDDGSTTRSVGVAQVHTLRVSFRPGASELEIRAALVASAARIVGGPTQIGEYWIASDLTSLDEIRAALLKSYVVVSMEVDLAGPRGQ